METSVPTTIEEFNTQAARFIQKAKAAGKSDTGIANTLKFMYQMMTQKMESQKGTKRATEIINDKYGNPLLIDKETGEVIKSYGDESSDSDLANLELSTGNQDTAPNTPSTFSDNNAPITTEKTLDQIYSDMGIDSKTKQIPVNDIKNYLTQKDPMSIIDEPGLPANIPLLYPKQQNPDGLYQAGTFKSPFKRMF